VTTKQYSAVMASDAQTAIAHVETAAGPDNNVWQKEYMFWQENVKGAKTPGKVASEW